MNQELFSLLVREQKNIERILSSVSKELKRLPGGRLEVTKTGGKYIQFIRVNYVDGVVKRKYIRKKEISLAQQLVQKASFH